MNSLLFDAVGSCSRRRLETWNWLVCATSQTGHPRPP